MATTAPQLTRAKLAQWEGFNVGLWQSEINVRDFIQQNYTPYYGDESYLVSATERTKKLWARLNELFLEERRKGVLNIFKMAQVTRLLRSTSFRKSARKMKSVQQGSMVFTVEM